MRDGVEQLSFHSCWAIDSQAPEFWKTVEPVQIPFHLMNEAKAKTHTQRI